MTYLTGRITGAFDSRDGTPVTGEVDVVPSVSVVRDLDGHKLIIRKQVAQVVGGAFAVDVPASSVGAGIDPSGVTYTLRPRLKVRPDEQPDEVVGIYVPAGQTIALADAMPLDPALPQYAVGVGPPGPPGDQGDQGDQGPAGLGAPPSGYPVLAVNLVRNPVPVGVSDYTPVRGTIADAGGFARVTITDANPAALAQRVETVGAGRPAVTPGRTYSFSSEVRTSIANGRLTLQLNFLNGSGGSVGSTPGPPVLAAGATFVPVSVSAVAPVGAVNVVLQPIAVRGDLAAPAVGDTMDFRRVMFHEGQIPLAYADGTTPGSRWAAAANASTTELITPRASDLAVFAQVGVRHLEGSGSPFGRIDAPVGWRYVDIDGTNGAVEWISTGPGVNAWRVTDGDTKWRNVDTLLGPLFTSQSPTLIRRVNGRVYLSLGVTNPAALTANVAAVLFGTNTLPGFAVDTTTTVSSDQPVPLVPTAILFVRSAYPTIFANLAVVPANSILRGPFEWFAAPNVPWPTGPLPGSAA